MLTATSLAVDINGKRIIDVSELDIPSGAVTGIIGPNGAGKSTLLRALAGVQPTADGSSVLWNGTDLLRLRRKDRARVIALVEQDSHTDEPLLVRQVVELGRTPHRPLMQVSVPDDDAVITEAMRTAGVWQYAQRTYSTLSGGQRQRVHLARAIAQEPRLMLLDEPTNHLDPRAQLEILRLTRDLTASSITVVMALHDLSLAAAHCDHLIVMVGGAVHTSGAPRNILTPHLIQQVYDVGAEVLISPGSGLPVVAMSLPTLTSLR
jgi:iron complex transport system ATP-binding protein